MDLGDDTGPQEDLDSRGQDAGDQDGGQHQEQDQGTPDAGAVPFDELIRLGKQRLNEARPHDALRLFEQAIELRPDHPDALFGAALAGAIDAIELTTMIFSLVEQARGFQFTRNEYIAEALHQELLSLREEYLLALERAGALEPEDLDFEVEGAWLYLGLEPVLMLRGVFDGGDLHLFRASMSFVTALLDVFCGQDLATDVLSVVNLLRGGVGSLDFANMGRIAGLLLNPEPRSFLRIHPEDGEAIFAKGRDHLAAVGRELELAVQWIQAEGEADGRPQVSRIEPLDGGDSFRVVVQGVVLPRSGEEDPAEVIEEAELVTTLDGPTLDAFVHASEAFAEPGELVPFREEAIPILATILYVGAQLGLLDDIMGSLPFDLRSLDRVAIDYLLATLLPLPAALDLGSFFSRPVGLRVFMPMLSQDEPARFIAEWECPQELDGRGYPPSGKGMLCSFDAELIDSAHFLDDPWAIQADGLGARIPYLVWDDPGFNGLLWVDLSELGVPGWTMPGYEPPDNYALNAMLAASIDTLLTLLSGVLD